MDFAAHFSWGHAALSTVSFILTLIFVSFILRAKRAAGSTVAWLLLICLAPYVGIPFYLFFSGRKITGKKRDKKKIFRPAAWRNESPEVASWQRILSTSGNPDPRANRRIELLPTGVGAYERLIRMIAGAQRSIHITTFIFGDDPVGHAILDALTERAKAGLDVRVILDDVGSKMSRHPSFRHLIEAGGKFAYFMPMFHLPFKGRANLRNHRKLMVVDGQAAIVGGMNLAENYLGPTEDPHRWVDLAVAIEGDCIGDIERIFLADWAYATHLEQPDAAPAPAWAPVPEDAHLLAQVVASGPDAIGDPIYEILLCAIFEAQKSIHIVTPYFIPDESLAKALELAAKRGVEVHVIVPKKSNHRLADLARGSFLRQLATAGAQIGYYPKMIHAKAVLVDRSMAVLGSANFDMRSLLLNYELGLLLYDPGNLQAIESWITAREKQAKPAAFRANSWSELGEGVGRVIGPLI